MMSKLQDFKDRLRALWNNLLNRPKDDSSIGVTREKVVVFFISVVLALCLWMLVNLSRDFNLNIDVPITLGNIPDNRALTEELPEFVSVSIHAEGWKLINMYNNPPRIYVDVTEEQVNLFEQVQQQVSAIPEINVQKVQPLMLNIELEEKVTKKVPVTAEVQVDFLDNFDFVGQPSLTPDSVSVSGAASIVENIEHWETDSTGFEEVANDIDATLVLKEPPPLIELDQREIAYRADVSEFTEGETRVPVETRNIPQGTNISFSPSYITIRYDVPIHEYNEVVDEQPFKAVVDFSAIEQDSTGFVTPEIQMVTEEYNLEIRRFQPSRLAYFNVIDS